MNERIETLRRVVEIRHECRAAHEQSIPLVEGFGGKTVWEGVVESFALTRHNKAKRCYAWSYQDRGETQFVTVLAIPPVVSPQTAVRAAILYDSRERYRVHCSIPAAALQGKRIRIEFDFDSYEYGHVSGIGKLSVINCKDGRVEIAIMADPAKPGQSRVPLQLPQELVDSIRRNPPGSQFQFSLKK